jgi:hypothetical protein
MEEMTPFQKGVTSEPLIKSGGDTGQGRDLNAATNRNL